ncbi:MAG: peptide deformylase [Chloroflexi bacterium]|nr:peptide deformylase [Chloroflexota bacterium]
MAVLKLRIVPDPILRAKAKKISRIDASIQKLADDMVDTMHHEGGVGLAAPQVGVLLRLITIEIPEVDREGGPPGASSKAGAANVYINPEVVEATGEREVEEGCLSVPNYRGSIFRHESVKVKALDRHGKPVKVKAEGLLAQALEHEIDHLNGILFIDHVKAHEDLWKIDREGNRITQEERLHESLHAPSQPQQPAPPAEAAVD